MKTDCKLYLSDKIDEFEAKSFEELEKYANSGEPYTDTVTIGNESYNLEIEIFKIDKDTIKGIGSIDDGGWRAFVPFSMGFEKSRQKAHDEAQSS